ncbi:hypothetical protein V1512DRAFT_263498 [Lipomyces arxii]|uniref:uncharacterized protein n=1 Tax=Lipomyces arxii TaxID=56418 RepID=UPI0034CEE4A9
MIRLTPTQARVPSPPADIKHNRYSHTSSTTSRGYGYEPYSSRTANYHGPGPAPARTGVRTGTTPEPGSVAGPNWPGICGAPIAGKSTRQLVWLIFGATGTLGSQVCRSALERGELVMACSRNIKNTVNVRPEWADRLETQTCDVRSRLMVKESVDKTIQRWNRIDVVVNTVSMGVILPCEEQEEHDVRAQFETNVMGMVYIIQTTLPFIRLRSSGRYIVFSSIAGIMGVPGLGPFSASKFAVEGLIESLGYEIEEFGGKCTLVYPGHSDAEESQEQRSPPWRHFVIKPMSNSYRGTPAEHAQRMILWVSDRRNTAVVKIGEIVWELAHSRNPPLRLLLGSEAIESMRNKLRQAIEEVEDWKFLFVGDDE